MSYRTVELFVCVTLFAFNYLREAEHLSSLVLSAHARLKYGRCLLNFVLPSRQLRVSPCSCLLFLMSFHPVIDSIMEIEHTAHEEGKGDR